MNKAKRRPTPPRTTRRPSRSGRKFFAASAQKSEAVSFGELLPALCRGIGLGSAAALAAGGVLLFLGAWILSSLSDPDGAMAALSMVILLLCSLLCGGVISRTVGHRALICGLCGGAVMLILLFLLSFLAAGQSAVFSPSAVIWLRVAAVVFSLFGAFLGSNLPKRR